MGYNLKTYFIDRISKHYNTITSTSDPQELIRARNRFLEVVKIGIDLGILTDEDLLEYDDNELYRDAN